MIESANGESRCGLQAARRCAGERVRVPAKESVMDSITSFLIVGVVIFAALIALGALLGSFFTVNTAERGVVERFNKFSRVAGPGLSLKIPFVESVHKVDMRVQELPFKIETKTKDNVFVVIPVS